MAADSLILEVADFETDVLTGIYSEETGKPQPLRITIQVRSGLKRRATSLTRRSRRARITWT
jgi:dihydroneopterin aldolase